MTEAGASYFAGVCVMPSIAAAGATPDVLFLLRMRRTAGLLAFAALMLAGSAYFGWHHAVNAYVSIMAVLLFSTFFSAQVLRQAPGHPQ
ncbi:hypothetical protein QN219_28055 [Sinorhizobium sp. 7-81]|uniref:hypothetical protein n=1 Tax=Sinorhizobium sp. 8-89 TaxID=3049089 RepID=UPI0024C2F6D3|nr:hypothetical protein [Sinorhizobium sp. 8-89]MDK1493849.1 hypothetical protein [Sinorhizobium sp. 8-89]